jgi:hypothetical protein
MQIKTLNPVNTKYISSWDPSVFKQCKNLLVLWRKLLYPSSAGSSKMLVPICRTTGETAATPSTFKKLPNFMQPQPTPKQF